MKMLLDEIKEFIRCKAYVLALCLTAACAYGFAVTQPIIGMDDTAIPLYFREGMAPYVGRWTLFLINKLFRMDEFAPWMVELISVLLLMLSVTLWCVLFRRVCKNRVSVPVWSYLFVACIFISCPLISEVFVFYLHNGICISYGLVALALLCLLESVRVGITGKLWISRIIGAVFFLSLALGCYESFAVVFAMGALMMFLLLRRLYGKKGEESVYQVKVLPWMLGCATTGIVSLVLRSVILAIVNTAFGLERFDSYNVLYRSLFGSLFQNYGDFLMELKRFWMKYYVNAIVYLPITVLVIAFTVIGIYVVYHGIRKKDVFLPLCFAGIVILPVLMCCIEGIATRYRTAQYVPLVGAFAVMLLLVEIYLHRFSKWLSIVCYLLLGVLIYNQCADMNKWFYVDYLKYQNMKDVMERVAYDLEKDYDTSKPIIFIGAYKVPYEISKDAYCSFSSEQYRWICLISDLVDPHLKEKYYAENGKGYIFAETPIVSTLQWGITAFDGTAGQLIEFWNMHGYSFQCETNKDKIAEATELGWEKQMPGYPKDGYILECDQYIIVNLASE